MKTVSVSKVELLAALKKNRDNHNAIYMEAAEGYRARAIELLKETLDKYNGARPDAKAVRLYVYLDAPEDHTADYDAVMAMLEWAREDFIQIDEETFRKYVLDDWNWKQSFLMANSAYSLTAARLSAAEPED